MAAQAFIKQYRGLWSGSFWQEEKEEKDDDYISRAMATETGVKTVKWKDNLV